MRLTQQQIQLIRDTISSIAGAGVQIRLFGSRLDDNAKGGDIDLLIDFSLPVERPALMASRLAAKLSRVLQGRKVDVVLRAPNLQELSIHTQALKESVLL